MLVTSIRYAAVLLCLVLLFPGQPEAVLDAVLDPSFRLWDAYGVLPVLCDPSKRGAKDACVVPYKHVKDIINQTKER